MFRLLVERELKSMIRSPRLGVTFSVCAILLILSAALGAQLYWDSISTYEATETAIVQEIEEAESWYRLENVIHRRPDPLRVFVAGVDYDVGTYAHAGAGGIGAVNLSRSVYAADALSALFRYFDFSFVVQVILSLLAILFTYDALSGDREQGTLRMVMSNSVGRTTVILAKLASAWIGLVVFVSLAILFAILVVIAFGIPLTGSDFARLALLQGVGLLYLTFFIAVGILVSAVTKHPSTSFLVLLATWAVLVLIIPRVATAVSGSIVKVTSMAELQSRKSQFMRNQFESYGERSQELQREMQAEEASMTRAEAEERQDEIRARWAERYMDLQKSMFDAIDEYGRSLDEQRRNQVIEMETLALTLARISPAAQYQLSASRLAGTGLEMKTRYLTALREYKQSYMQFVDGKNRALMSGADPESVKPRLSEFPRFRHPEPLIGDVLKSTLLDIGLLVLLSLLAFAGAYVAFLRYDVR